jgi:hypothetical protein
MATGSVFAIRGNVMIRRFIPVLLGAMTALAAMQAQAQDMTPRQESENFVRRVLGSLPGDKPATACFVRTYDAAHLAAHPQQKVRQVLFLFRASEIQEDNFVSYTFITGFRVKGRAGRLDTSGSCGHARLEGEGPITHLNCGVDCDGGGVRVEVVEGNKSILMRMDNGVSVEPAATRMNPDEPPQRIGLPTGADDKVFRLDRVAIDQCTQLLPTRKDFLEFINEKS